MRKSHVSITILGAMDVIAKKEFFTRDEKVLLFNDLRKGYAELVKRLKDNEKFISSNSPSLNKDVDISESENESGIRNIHRAQDDVDSLLESSDDEAFDVNDKNVINCDKKKKKRLKPSFKTDPDLPYGWKYADIDNTKSASHSMGKIYMDPEGGKHPGVASIAKYYIDKGKGVGPIKKFLQREGWFETDLLPSGCFMRQKLSEKGFCYLTPGGIKFNTTKRMIEYLRQEFKWEKSYIEKFINDFQSHQKSPVKPRNRNRNIKEEKTERNENELHNLDGDLQTGKDRDKKDNMIEKDISLKNLKNAKAGKDKKRKFAHWESDCHFPQGWSSRQGLFGLQYKSPEGNFFNTKYEAIKYLRDTKQVSSIDMDKLIDSFTLDGWKPSTSLPIGWFSRKASRSAEEYLTNTFVILRTMEEAVKYLKDNNYSDLIIDQFKEGNVIKYKTDPDLPPGWRYAEHDATNSASHFMIKTYMDPDGKKYGGIPSMVRHFAGNDDVAPLKKFLKREGWFETGLLPEGCFLRQKFSEKDFWYLTPKGVKLNCTKRMIQYLREEHQWMESCITKFINEYKSLATKDVKPKKKRIKSEKFDEENKAEEIKEHLDNDSDEGYEYDEEGLKWKSDIFLPDGWKVSVSKLGNGCEVRRYMSPEGKLLGNLPKALKHISEFGDVTEDQMSILKDGLEYEGWSKEPRLPEGWMVKIENGQMVYLSPEFEQYSNEESVLRYLKKCSSSESIEKFTGKPVKDWMGDPLLPDNWEMCWEQNHAGKRRYPKFRRKYGDGKIFQGRPEAIKEMLRRNYSIEDIEKMKKGLLTDDGWERTTYLPPGWLKRKSNDYNVFLTPDLQTIRSRGLEKIFEKLKLDKSLIPIIKKEVSLKASSLDNEWEDDPSNKRSREEEEDMSTESIKVKKKKFASKDIDYLPSKWTIKEDLNGEKEIFINNYGEEFKTRIEALQFMIKKSYDPKTIMKFWNSLEEDGWRVMEDRIPSGWRAQYCPDILDYRYLTQDMTLLRSTEEASTNIKDKGDFVQIIKFESWAAEVQRQAPALVWSSSDPALPRGWSLAGDRTPEILRNSAGARFAGRREAVQFMIRAGCNPEDIFRLWSSLGVEGWESDEANLPREWRRRYAPATRSHHYLSPMMDIVTSEAELLNLVADGYTQEDRRKVIKWVASL